MAFDFKKEYKEFYMPSKQPGIITIPPMNYVAVRGQGNPNEETGEYMVSTGIGITKEHNPWKLIEEFENTDIYTNEEIEKYADEVWAGCDMSAW